MSAAALSTVGFYESTIGKKVVMALTGVILFGYVIGHLLGNLQVYLGRERLNAYGEFLHSNPNLLWVARVVLLAAVGLHILSSFQLWLLKRRARPNRYVKYEPVASSYASRTMMWSGPIIAAFVVFHVLHLTIGDVMAIDAHDIYGNVVAGFRQWQISIAYVVAVVLLGFHLQHGIWSMFQSLGVSHPRFTPLLKHFSVWMAGLIVAGYVSIPVAVLAGLVG